MANKSNKVGMFLFVIFIILAAVFFTYITRITTGGLNTITDKKREMDCNNLYFDINNIIYKNQRLIFELSSDNYNFNISYIEIESDTGEYTNKTFETPLPGGNQKLISIEEMPVDEYFFITIENCENNKRKIDLI